MSDEKSPDVRVKTIHYVEAIDEPTNLGTARCVFIMPENLESGDAQSRFVDWVKDDSMRVMKRYRLVRRIEVSSVRTDVVSDYRGDGGG